MAHHGGPAAGYNADGPGSTHPISTTTRDAAMEMSLERVHEYLGDLGLPQMWYDDGDVLVQLTPDPRHCLLLPEALLSASPVLAASCRDTWTTNAHVLWHPTKRVMVRVSVLSLRFDMEFGTYFLDAHAEPSMRESTYLYNSRVHTCDKLLSGIGLLEFDFTPNDANGLTGCKCWRTYAKTVKHLMIFLGLLCGLKLEYEDIFPHEAVLNTVTAQTLETVNNLLAYADYFVCLPLIAQRLREVVSERISSSFLYWDDSKMLGMATALQDEDLYFGILRREICRELNRMTDEGEEFDAATLAGRLEITTEYLAQVFPYSKQRYPQTIQTLQQLLHGLTLFGADLELQEQDDGDSSPLRDHVDQGSGGEIAFAVPRTVTVGGVLMPELDAKAQAAAKLIFAQYLVKPRTDYKSEPINSLYGAVRDLSIYKSPADNFGQEDIIRMAILHAGPGPTRAVGMTRRITRELGKMTRKAHECVGQVFDPDVDRWELGGDLSFRDSGIVDYDAGYFTYLGLDERQVPWSGNQYEQLWLSRDVELAEASSGWLAAVFVAV